MQQLIGALLEKKPHARLGFMANALGGAQLIQQHPFLQPQARGAEAAPPWRPESGAGAAAAAAGRGRKRRTGGTGWRPLRVVKRC